MILKTELNNRYYEADLNSGIDISIAIGKTNQVKAYGIPDAEISIYRDGGFVGDVSSGGSCNVRDIKFNPHGNGTHTECVGHVSDPYLEINSINIPSHFAAILVTVETSECVLPNHLELLKNEPHTKGLIIRTLPNTAEKLTKNYTGASAVYIHPDAMKMINQLGIEHLMVDLPSVDHETDPKLQSHKIFWDLKSGTSSTKTITELVYVPNSLKDGMYLVNLMIPNMQCDAVPSKPILYPLR